MHLLYLTSLLVSFLLVASSIAATPKHLSHHLLRRQSTGAIPTLIPILTAELQLGARFPLVPVPGGQQEGKSSPFHCDGFENV